MPLRPFAPTKDGRERRTIISDAPPFSQKHRGFPVNLGVLRFPPLRVVGGLRQGRPGIRTPVISVKSNRRTEGNVMSTRLNTEDTATAQWTASRGGLF